MGDTMFFPETWEEFLKDYEFKDSKEIYTNGAMLVPSFRVEQMMEHYTNMRYGRWTYTPDWFEDDGCMLPYHKWTCSNCGGIERQIPKGKNYCSYCGAKMVLEDCNEID